MARTYVVTGSAAGIGRATAELLESDGHRVIDVDLRDASINLDLATAAGRAALADEVRKASGGTVDAVVANAGTTATPELCVRVNYFGAVATIEELRPLLAGSAAPRVVATASCSVLNPFEPAVLDACLADDEEAAVAAAEPIGFLAYPTSKRALARWVRREAPTERWAGAGIALNAVAPGIVRTAMATPLIEDPAMKAVTDAAAPMPYQGYAEPEHVARLIAFLADGETMRITGQVLFIDGGVDVVLRGDDVFGPGLMPPLG